MTSDAEIHPRGAVVDRRAVIGAGTTVIGLGLLTAACGSPASAPAAAPPTGASAAASTTTAAAAPTTPPSTPAPAPPSSAPAAPRPPAHQGVVLGPTSAVPVGGGAVFAGARVVVTQPTAGRFVGLSAVCTHQGCTVAQVSGGTINCPCHGSRYHLDGTVARGPAARALAHRPVTVVGNQIELA